MNLISFKDFGEFNIIASTNSSQILISSKNLSPHQKYLFKIFNFQCISSEDQKQILETFSDICKTKSQYLLSYNHFSFSYQSSLNPTFSMKYIQTKTLKEYLEKPELFDTLQVENILQCLFAVAEGMSYLHSHLLIHGNLCPSNIVVDESIQFYVIDFGLYPIKELYIKGDQLFNNDYKDPCMISNEPTLKSDIYAYGVLICELFLSFLQKQKNENEPKESLKEFLQNNDQNKFNSFPPFFVEIIKSCLTDALGEIPSFNYILNLFRTTDQTVFGVNIQQLYNEFVQSNYLINLAGKNDSFALNKVGKMFEKGEVFEKDLNKALVYYEKAAELKNSEAQNNYGILLQEVSNDQDDHLKSIQYLQRSAEQGNIHGMANYSIALMNGNGVEKDIGKACEFLKKSADFGFSYAQVNYGLLLLNSNPTVSLINEGFSYIKKAMKQNNADAFYTFGVLLLNGQFIEKNDELAMENFKIAADMGNDKAIYEYARGNEEGVGVPKNEIVALKYYQQLFERGNVSVKEDIDRLIKKLERSQEIPPMEDSNKEAKAQKQKTNVDLSNVTFPLKVSPKIKLISLGEIEYNRINYHNENYIYPIGYQIEKEFISIDDPNAQAIYRGTVIDGGDSPIFRVECTDGSNRVFDGPTPTSPWRDLVLAIENTKMKLGIPAKKSNSISGPEAFGFAFRIVSHLIESLPNARRCVNYRFKNYYIENKSGIQDNEIEDDHEPMNMEPFNIDKSHALNDEDDEEYRETNYDEEEVKTPKKKSSHSSNGGNKIGLQYNKDGSIKMPIYLSPTSYIINIGTIVSDRPAFHSERYIYPAGFKSSRLYMSVHDPSKKVRYTSEIIDDGSDAPVFRVTMDDEPDIKYEGPTPTSPWRLIGIEIAKSNKKFKSSGVHSGPEYFGLSSRCLFKLLQSMPGFSECTKFNPNL